jgi:Ca2+-binding EF-hand superfamily protein
MTDMTGGIAMFRAVVLLLAVVFAPSVAAAQQPCTTDARRVVNELYRHMLERQADDASAGWVQQLESGRMTVREIVHKIADSPEYAKRFVYTEVGEAYPHERSVGRLYRHLLGRQPDAEGQRAFANIAQREGVHAVIHRIIDSREYNEIGDWGVPGSGGLRYCGNNAARSNQSAAAAVDNNDIVPINQRRFRGMDRNNDGVVSRQEWRGSPRSFAVHDWNNDGVISGREINQTAARDGRTVEDEDFDRVDEFANLDVNNNRRIDAREWHGSVAAFNRLDVNNDDRLSEAEFAGQVVTSQTAATSGESIVVDARERWIDTGVNVRQGDLIMFDVSGEVRLSADQNDLAAPGGARSGRRAPDSPLNRQAAGALIGRIGNSNAFGIGNQRSIRAPATGRLYLSVNDDYLADNAGHFEVQVNVQ